MDRRRKILITGAAGFIGSQLGLRLHRDGHDVVLLDNLKYGYRENLVWDDASFGGFHQRDIREADLRPLFENVDTVFHLAAISALPVCQSEPLEAISVNVAGTANILEAARRAGVRRVVVASTSAVYENNTSFPCAEDHPITPTLVYSVSKKQAEELCRSYALDYGMEVVITRYYNVYGPQADMRRKSPPFVAYVIRELLAGRAPVLHSDGEQKRDYVYVADVNALNIACMEHPEAAGKTFNVASGVARSVNEIFDTIADILQTSIKPIFRPAAQFWDNYPELFAGPFPLREGRLAAEVDKFSLGSTRRAKEVLGWEARTPFRDGLAETVKHIQAAAARS